MEPHGALQGHTQLTWSRFTADGELTQCEWLLAGKARLMDPPERALPK